MWRAFASNALTALIFLLLVMSGVVYWGQSVYKGEGPLEQAICYRLQPGSYISTVSKELLNADAISNDRIFRIGADYEKKASQLKAGSFLIPERASMEQIIDIVTHSGANTCGTEIVYRVGIAASGVQIRELDPVTQTLNEVGSFIIGEPPVAAFDKLVKEPDTRHRVTFAEGVTSWQVVQAVNAIPVLDGRISDIPEEGTLAPDSYEVKAGDTRASVIDRMRERQSQILANAWENRVDGLPYATPQDALIMASIIEKETAVPSERRTVSSVFVNRLKREMPLQTDPTVIYGITLGQGILGRGLRQSELRKNTPWNTYTNRGLPKTPIANPGKASIEAALDPDGSKFIFFVADGTGGHAFATTLAEHNKNVAKWRAIEAAKNE